MMIMDVNVKDDDDTINDNNDNNDNNNVDIDDIIKCPPVWNTDSNTNSNTNSSNCNFMSMVYGSKMTSMLDHIEMKGASSPPLT